MLPINESRCRRIGGQLKILDVHDHFYHRSFLKTPASRESKLRMYLFSAAICHQTHTLHHPGLNLWGWEYLEHGFLKMMNRGDLLFDATGFDSFTAEELSLLLAREFAPDSNPANTTLDRLDERVNMLKEIIEILRADYNDSVSAFIDASGAYLLNNGEGLYEKLARFQAFPDEQKKKITFFIKLAADAGELSIKDPENLIPIMDYHMQRVLLRMGCVNLDGTDWGRILKTKTQLDTDEPVRSACIDAIRLIAKESGHSILKMNDFFWPLGRSCCNTSTLCTDKQCIKSPCTFSSMIDIEEHTNCPFEQVCLGSMDENYRSLWEPMVETDYY